MRGSFSDRLFFIKYNQVVGNDCLWFGASIIIVINDIVNVMLLLHLNTPPAGSLCGYCIDSPI